MRPYSLPFMALALVLIVAVYYLQYYIDCHWIHVCRF